MTNMALELVSATVTAPGAGGSNMAAVAGNSLRVRDSKSARLVSIWGHTQANGVQRITSPLLHDAVVGLEQQVAGNSAVEQHLAVPQPLQSQDQLTVFQTGSATGGDIQNACLLILYEALAGVCASLITIEELRRRAIESYQSSQTLTLGSAGGYSGDEALTAEEDQLKANDDYAIVGFSGIGDNISAIRYVAPDWGNLGIGSIWKSGSQITSDWLSDLAWRMGLPVIPVFNASNKDLVTVSALGNEDATTALVTTNMVRLRPVGKGKAV